MARRNIAKHIRRVIFYTAVFGLIGIASVFVSHDLLDLTSSNSAIYIVKGSSGGIEVKRDLFTEDADRLIFTLNLNDVFAYLAEGLAAASNEPRLEVTWDAESGVGDVKQFRPDGTILIQSFSRFKEIIGPAAHGLFLGGDVPYADADRSEDGNSSGFSYYNGKKWIHIWCAANEGFVPLGTSLNVEPKMWEFVGSRVEKDTSREAIIVSEHRLDTGAAIIGMRREAIFKAGQDYFILKVAFTNEGNYPISYNLAYGDEPWVGDFGSSEGDVGWSGDNLLEYETNLPAAAHGSAGYWDRGNRAAGDNYGYTGYANFIEWFEKPSRVFFSNSDACCHEGQPLNAVFNRLLMLAWYDQQLKPGETKQYTLAIGMAKPDPVSGFPVKPEVKHF